MASMHGSLHIPRRSAVVERVSSSKVKCDVNVCIHYPTENPKAESTAVSVVSTMLIITDHLFFASLFIFCPLLTSPTKGEGRMVRGGASF